MNIIHIKSREEWTKAPAYEVRPEGGWFGIVLMLAIACAIGVMLAIGSAF